MSLAILNGFGRTFGDGIIGLQALFAARELAGLPRPVLFRLPGLPPMVQAVHEAADFADLGELPWPDETPTRPFAGAAGFSRVIDLRDFAFDPGFRGVAMIDFFLGRLGLDPAAVPAALKRNAWLKPRLRPEPPADRGYVLVCPRTASRLRDMPDEAQAHILAWLGARGIQARSQADLPPARTLAELAGLVAAARLLVCADTGMVHLADAMEVPCLAFFTTHRPEWRVRDYPLCHPVFLPVPGLPPALEFVRDEADITAACAAWFPLGRLEAALEAVWRKIA